ncbi:pyrimidine dimer DNA glycosylase/endonuclease V [Klugiella xanthotipulae]|uniref:Uncharacterized protein n=1 Tax=Klugiella xanthotipulae TaxID=244735 RepID=A0A543HXJ6_9MICO|nr:pyrimidine dimer DNA glycosylase/endonuclease V [Klugiella xanthotipulae]TQM63056.1 hypothetical protein FB466_1305 [Klugiella xanthotipulae]
MRIWSLDPSYLDNTGLAVCWRETLLAQEALAGNTTDDSNHPQLIRFRGTDNPPSAISTYLHLLADEADARGYSFDRELVALPADPEMRITVTTAQLRYEFDGLCAQLTVRDPGRAEQLLAVHDADTIPMEAALFRAVEGPIERWETQREF